MHLTETIGAAQFIFFAAVVTATFAVRGATGFGSAAIAVPLGAVMLADLVPGNRPAHVAWVPKTAASGYR